MLNNTKQKSELNELNPMIEDQPLISLGDTERKAANAANFHHLRGTESNMRRERRYSRNSSAIAGGWRVTLW